MGAGRGKQRRAMSGSRTASEIADSITPERIRTAGENLSASVREYEPGKHPFDEKIMSDRKPPSERELKKFRKKYGVETPTSRRESKEFKKFQKRYGLISSPSGEE